MSIFPTKILLATDGSSEAQVAARAAVELTQKTDSELHAIHVVDVVSSIALLYPQATDPERIKQMVPNLKEVLERHSEQRGREPRALTRRSSTARSWRGSPQKTARWMCSIP